jgi:hypothetical protein
MKRISARIGTAAREKRAGRSTSNVTFRADTGASSSIRGRPANLARL